MKITGFGIANYRSFGSSGEFVRDIGKVNIFIGKNNSGKSNVLQFLQHIRISRTADPSPRQRPNVLDHHRMASNPPCLAVCATLDDELDWMMKSQKENLDTESLDIWTGDSSGTVGCSNPLDCDSFSDYVLGGLHEKLTHSRFLSPPGRDTLLARTFEPLAKKAEQDFTRQLTGLIYVPAIREIRAESSEGPGTLELSGHNLVHVLRMMQHPKIGKESDQQKYEQIVEMVRCLLNVAELKMEISAEEDDIYLTMHDKVRLPLASFGTGIHELVIICSTLALHEDCWVCIEEPEIHLHPELVRRFLQFLHKTKNTYFIATHSNVLLDADESNTIYHVTHDGTSSRITRSTTNETTRAILRDLGYRASDLLQTNGIIWVEGPSDRIYIKKWLELSGCSFVEGLHYTIMFYGGACLANLSCGEPVSASDFIDLLRINPNVIVVIDRDGPSKDTPLREYKERIRHELGDEQCWITKGREIENYLSPSILQRYLEARFSEGVRPVRFHSNQKIDASFKKALPEKPFTYSRNKRKYADEICKVMKPEDMNQLDLLDWMGRLNRAIESWNPK